jgi:hypothetical protein
MKSGNVYKFTPGELQYLCDLAERVLPAEHNVIERFEAESTACFGSPDAVLDIRRLGT